MSYLPLLLPHLTSLNIRLCDYVRDIAVERRDIFVRFVTEGSFQDFPINQVGFCRNPFLTLLCIHPSLIPAGSELAP